MNLKKYFVDTEGKNEKNKMTLFSLEWFLFWFRYARLIPGGYMLIGVIFNLFIAYPIDIILRFSGELMTLKDALTMLVYRTPGIITAVFALIALEVKKNRIILDLLSCVFAVIQLVVAKVVLKYFSKTISFKIIILLVIINIVFIIISIIKSKKLLEK